MILGWDTDQEFVYDLQLATAQAHLAYYTFLVIKTSNEYHSHDYWEMAYILNGNATHYLNGQRIPLTRGDAFILRPHDKHCLYREPNAEEKYTHRDFYVPTEVMKTICDCIDPTKTLYDNLLNAETPPQFHIAHTKRQMIEQAASLLHNQENTPPDIFFRSVIIELLAYYLSLQSVSNYPTWIVDLINRIKRNTTNMKTIDDFVKSTGYCHAHVCREFKKYTGERLHEFITKTKLEYSMLLLTSSNNTIADIAYLLGFSNESNYICCFKKYFNTTPHQWRIKNTPRSK